MSYRLAIMKNNSNYLRSFLKIGVGVILTRDQNWHRRRHPSCITYVQSWPKKFVLGCVIPPAGTVVRSRNLQGDPSGGEPGLG